MKDSFGELKCVSYFYLGTYTNNEQNNPKELVYNAELKVGFPFS